MGFVVLELPQYFFQRARKLAQNLLDSDSDLIETSRHAAFSPLPPSPSAAISSRLHHSPLSHLASSTDRSRPLSLPPPSHRVALSLALVLVVSVVGRRGQWHCCIRCRCAGGGGRSHPSWLPAPPLYSRRPTSALVATSATTSPPPPSSPPHVERPSLQRTPPQRFC